MSSKANKTSSFLRAMNPEGETATASAAPAAAPAAAARPKADAKTSSRAGLKHIGGYLDRDTVEMVAVLRARLSLDNSELITLAIKELHQKHEAKRAYGDA